MNLLVRIAPITENATLRRGLAALTMQEAYSITKKLERYCEIGDQYVKNHGGAVTDDELSEVLGGLMIDELRRHVEEHGSNLDQ